MCVWLVILLTTVASVMPVLAFRFLKVDLFPTLSDQVSYSADEYLQGWVLALGIVTFTADQKTTEGPMHFAWTNIHRCTDGISCI